jgi:tRNA(Ile2) C34 agmatinyltransferase TiaS
MNKFDHKIISVSVFIFENAFGRRELNLKGICVIYCLRVNMTKLNPECPVCGNTVNLQDRICQSCGNLLDSTQTDLQQGIEGSAKDVLDAKKFFRVR